MPALVAATVQERAWSSPIWFTPTDEARQAAKPGLTVAALKQQGAVALDDAQLKALIVGKSTWIRNNVTGGVVQIIWSQSGRRLITDVDGKVPAPRQIGDVLHGGEIGSPASYAIGDGRIVTPFGNAPLEVTVYKVGDKYYGAQQRVRLRQLRSRADPVNLVDLSEGKAEKAPF